MHVHVHVQCMCMHVHVACKQLDRWSLPVAFACDGHAGFYAMIIRGRQCAPHARRSCSRAGTRRALDRWVGWWWVERWQVEKRADAAAHVGWVEEREGKGMHSARSTVRHGRHGRQASQLTRRAGRRVDPLSLLHLFAGARRAGGQGRGDVSSRDLPRGVRPHAHATPPLFVGRAPMS